MLPEINVARSLMRSRVYGNLPGVWRFSADVMSPGGGFVGGEGRALGDCPDFAYPQNGTVLLAQRSSLPRGARDGGTRPNRTLAAEMSFQAGCRTLPTRNSHSVARVVRLVGAGQSDTRLAGESAPPPTHSAKKRPAVNAPRTSKGRHVSFDA